MLVKLRRFSGEELAISSWWSRLATILSVSERMDLVPDIATDVKTGMRPNTVGMTFSSCIYL